MRVRFRSDLLLPLLLTCAAGLAGLGTAAQPGADTAGADSSITSAGADTVPTMAGVHFVNIDSLLLAGSNILLAFEDTIPFQENSIDTILVTAPRIRVEEVIRRIGERLEADRYRIKEHEFTTLVNAVVRFAKKEGKPQKYIVYESAARTRKDKNGAYQEATLWEREREFKGDEMVKEKIDDEVNATWNSAGEGVRHAQPFSLDSGDAYSYAILDRKLVGLNVVYKISFTPKNQFDALSSGTVWIDYSDFVIRRIDANLTGTVPMPMILEGIPIYKIRRIPKGDFWVVDDIYGKIELRDIPLTGIPENVEVYVRTLNHTINGVTYPDDAGEGSADGR